MGRVHRGFAALVAFAVPLAACSLVVDTNGLSGVALGDGSLADAASDGGPSGDSPSLPPDGAPNTTEAGATTCLESAGEFCDAFDDSTPGSRWSNKETKRGTIAFSAGGLSPPNAFVATITAGAVPAYANLVKTFPSPRTSMRCDIDLKLTDVPTAGELDVLDLVAVVPGTDDHHVYFAAYEGIWKLAEFYGGGGGAPSVDRTQNLGTPLPKDTWFHVTLAFAGATATLTANGTTVTLASLTTPSNVVGAYISVGIPYASDNIATATVVVDNVGCVTKP
ncbi:MAG: hypothetical protein JWP87_4388 [Labilithrix sp.]|jgi:hypothetical protein|nr:hypothetical protein [Labilithrix sp.]